MSALLLVLATLLAALLLWWPLAAAVLVLLPWSKLLMAVHIVMIATRNKPSQKTTKARK